MQDPDQSRGLRVSKIRHFHAIAGGMDPDIGHEGSHEHKPAPGGNLNVLLLSGIGHGTGIETLTLILDVDDGLGR